MSKDVWILMELMGCCEWLENKFILIIILVDNIYPNVTLSNLIRLGRQFQAVM